MKYVKSKNVRKVYPKKSIALMSRKIDKIAKETTQKRVMLWLRGDGVNQTVNLQAPVSVMKLTNFVTDVAIFGTDPNDLLGSKALLKSINYKIDVRLENLSETEEETQNIEMFIVSLKDDANDIFNVTTGNIAPVDGIHYYRYGAIYNMITYLNKKYFTIHKHTRFTLTNYGSQLGTSGAQTIDGTDKRIDGTLKINKIIKAPLSNATDQSWKTLVCPRDPSLNYYVLWFNDNSALDGEFPRVTMVSLKKFEKLDN